MNAVEGERDAGAAGEPSDPEPSSVAQWSWSPATDEVVWSDGLFRLLRRPAGVQPTLEETITQVEGPGRPAARSFVDAARRGSVPPEVVFRVVRGDGEVRELESKVTVERAADGSLVRVSGLTRDVTDRRAPVGGERPAEVGGERRLREFVDGLPLAAVELDDRGNVVFANPATAELLGCPIDQILGAAWFERFVPADQWELVRPMYTSYVRTGQGPGAFEHEVVRCDGERRTVRWRGRTIERTDGRIVGVIGFGEDITDRLRVEEDRRVLVARLQQAQKMDAVGRLAGGIAHDFNNILTAIRSCGELLRDISVDPLAAELLDEIDAASRRASELTRRLLTFGRREIASPRPVDPGMLVGELEPTLRHMVGEDVELTIVLSPDVPMICADRALLEQVIFDLAANGREAMPGGGVLRIEVDGVNLGPDDPRARAELTVGRFARVRVRDTGVGMSEDVKARIFEPFFTTRSGGSGLALATAFAIARQHGGALSVASEPGDGATFELMLPARAVTAEGPTTPPPKPSSRERRTILVADDEVAVRRVFARALRAWGYEVLEAGDGIEALALAGAHDGPIDLLLTDVVMPGLDGRRLAERLAERQPGLRVLFVSGHTTDEVLRRGVQEDRVAFLHKPFTPRELAARVVEVLAAPD